MSEPIEPGCLAIVIGDSIYAGRIVEVLYVAPADDFRLPDGKMHFGSEEIGHWVIKFQSPVDAPLFIGDRQTGSRKTLFGVGSERKMRRLPEVDETETSKQDERIPA